MARSYLANSRPADRANTPVPLGGPPPWDALAANTRCRARTDDCCCPPAAARDCPACGYRRAIHIAAAELALQDDRRRPALRRQMYALWIALRAGRRRGTPLAQTLIDLATVCSGPPSAPRPR